MLRHRLTDQADRDITGILRETRKLFGVAADATEIVILRVLHEAMEPRRRIVSALSSAPE